MYKDEDTNEICAYVEKDRTKVHEFGETIINPTLLDYQEMFDKSVGRKEFNVQNNFDKAVETDQKILEKEIFGSDAESTSSTKSAKEIVAEINALIKPLPLPEKQSVRTKLKEAGLPDTFAKLTDTEVLTKILETVKENI
jgi:hypothetical protein